jgi:hypothetical protein
VIHGLIGGAGITPGVFFLCAAKTPRRHPRATRDSIDFNLGWGAEESGAAQFLQEKFSRVTFDVNSIPLKSGEFS